MATKVVLEGAFVWRDARLHKRSIAIALDRVAFARRLLRDRSADVQIHALQYLSQNMEDDASLQQILLRYLLHPRRKLSELAQWKLSKRGVDWLAWIRTEFDTRPHDLPLARLLARVGTQEDGERLWRATSDAPDGMRSLLMLGAARLGQGNAIEQARNAAIGNPSLAFARAAAVAMLEAHEVIGVDDLDAAALNAPSFDQRGLLLHLRRHRVATHLRILCRLEAEGSPPDSDELRRVGRRLNIGAFDPSDAELAELRRRAVNAPRVAGWMRRAMII